LNHASALPPLPRSLRWLASLRGYLVIVTDARGLTLSVNEAHSRTTGYRLADLAGQTPGSRLQSPQTDPATKALLHEAVASGLGCTGVDRLHYESGIHGLPHWSRVWCHGRPWPPQRGRLWLPLTL
jgi:PAS domain-containing protein